MLLHANACSGPLCVLYPLTDEDTTMNVSNMTKAQLVAALSQESLTLVQCSQDMQTLTEKYVALRQENDQLRTLNAQWAHQSKADANTIARLKAHQPRGEAAVTDFAQRCREYCAQYGVRSVPADVAREWRA